MASVLSWVLLKGTETCGRRPGHDNCVIVSEEYTYW
jgi:hypothetical protein